jgi:hypothetical protein
VNLIVLTLDTPCLLSLEKQVQEQLQEHELICSLFNGV